MSFRFSLWKELFMERIGGYAKSFFEVFTTVCFTFVPFFFLSIRWQETDGSNSLPSIWKAFSSFWQSGEIVLPLLGLSGAVVSLLALNVGYFSWWVHAMIGALILVFTIGGGAALTGSRGFDVPLNNELVVTGFVGYGLLALVWFLLAAKVRTTEPKLRSSGESAQSILEQARRRRASGGAPQ
ncbi:MAG: hypothetical protein NXI27_30110 [Alphaproteobacteria bacterium]|nr:hypothetical protein [Alphaproteobacteria bacterium]